MKRIEGPITLDKAEAFLKEETESVSEIELKEYGLRLEDSEEDTLVFLQHKKDASNFYKLSRIALSNLLHQTHVPITFLKKHCSDEKLRTRIVDHCFSEIQGKSTLLARRNDVKTIIEGKSDISTSLDVFKTVVDALPNPYVHSISVNGSVRMKIVSPDTKRSAGELALKDRKVDDVIEGGLFVEIGRVVRVSTYILRLVCTNGAMRDSYENTFSTFATKDSLPLLRFQARNAFDTVNNYMNEFVDTRKLRVEDPALLINRFSRNGSISPSMAQYLTDRVPTLPEAPTYYDVVNLITETARDHAKMGDFSTEDKLVGFADSMIEESTHKLCSKCYKPV